MDKKLKSLIANNTQKELERQKKLIQEKLAKQVKPRRMYNYGVEGNIGSGNTNAAISRANWLLGGDID